MHDPVREKVARMHIRSKHSPIGRQGYHQRSESWGDTEDGHRLPHRLIVVFVVVVEPVERIHACSRHL